MYKNIILFWNNGWQADYSDNGKRFALHRCCCRTKKVAYEIAKEEVDYLYVNIETGDVYTESELRNLYEEFKADWSDVEREIYSSFDYWLNSALDRNGSLRRI